ncbi:rhodanese-like domain-containing protein [Anaerobacillus isosaccharinicus]|uniref:Rhodanese-like domain-containing protein n=1 Tax=Anaerobacillus isosaccharinicus TaxID=1532552 RepID=A0A1S2M3K6_9BACI|nr:rhodanese-like domain-containing protein [Anaerobacillus isosaccharinicus]MBA5588239.1 rhodanese-like domain-containing protein [Anaerobacillus isosaccharinicus]QOY38316.1 rhodanese-like domain-containing protein [Anaerobacillus isosaccharinicus]
MKKLVLMMFTALVAVGLAACSSDNSNAEEKQYNYISADEVKQKIENNEDMILLDIQPEEEFNSHHIVGAIPTYAYPAKSAEDHAKLEPLVTDLKNSEHPIVIVCPGGGSGAKGTIDYYEEQGIPSERLIILEKGQKNWPHKDLLADK